MCRKYIMGDLLEILDSFSGSSTEPEIQAALSEFFCEFGQTETIQKSPLSPTRNGKRQFVVTFHNPDDAFKVASKLKLRSFAYNGVLVEVC